LRKQFELENAEEKSKQMNMHSFSYAFPEEKLRNTQKIIQNKVKYL